MRITELENSMGSTNFSAGSDKGLHRGNNEDSYLSSPEHGLWVIADGMGGHEAGEVASAIVAETIHQRFAQEETVHDGTLVDSIQKAHQSVLEAVSTGVGAQGMGSTVVALSSKGREYEVAWVGDSRAYLWTPDEQGGTLEQLSTDHSYVQMLVASGAIGEHEAANHPDRNVITQCIGSPDVREVQVDSVRGQWQQGQWILLCSDGLSDELSDKAIAQVLCSAGSVREAVDRLIRQALKHGGRDNITVQIVESPLDGAAMEDAWDKLPMISTDERVNRAIYTGLAALLLLALAWSLS